MAENSPLALYLLFDRPFIPDAAKLRSALQQSPTLKGTLPFSGKKVDVNSVAAAKAGGLLEIKFDEHQLRLVVINVPLPATELEMPLQVAHLRPEHKASIQQQRSHAIVYYDGGSDKTVEKFIALYIVANACTSQGLIGVVNPQTWMCLIPGMLAETVKADFIKSFRASPAAAIAVWVGFVKFFRPDKKVWFATRGAGLFGVPEFAYLGALNEADTAIDMFGTLISYVYQSGATLAAGHTIELPGKVYLRFGSVTEYADYIGHDTLVLERISASGINRPGGA